MKPELRPISITIVDFMGVFLPGTVWLVLFATFGDLLWNLFSIDKTPIDKIKDLLKELDPYSTTALLLLSILIGYAIKPSVMSVAEYSYAVFPYIWFKILKRNKDVKLSSYKLPFDNEHSEEDYYKKIVKLISTNLGNGKSANSELISLPKQKTQPFSICKRILREISPSLWEEAERREAEVRMLGSFFLSSIFSLFCSLVSLIRNSQSKSVWIWFGISLFVVIFLGLSFVKQKKAEVRYVYMNFLVANSKFLKNLMSESREASKNV